MQNKVQPAYFAGEFYGIVFSFGFCRADFTERGQGKKGNSFAFAHTSILDKITVWETRY
jgi:hypothetical protein